MKLVRYEEARAALAFAHRVDEVKDIRDKAEALAAYARQAKDNDLIAWATEIKVRAERRAGELLAQMEKKPRQRTDLHDAGKSEYTAALEHLADNRKTAEAKAHRWQKLAAIPEDEFEQSVNATKEVMGEVTTAAILSQTKKKKRAVSRMADEDTPVVIPPDKPKSIKSKVYDVWTAIETLAHTDIDPAQLRSLMDDFQWHHIDSDLEPALNFLTALRAHWSDDETARSNRRMLRASA